MKQENDYSDLEELARQGRWLVLSTVAGSGAGHVGGPMSAMDLLISLFFRGMEIKPEEPKWPERDRFIAGDVRKITAVNDPNYDWVGQNWSGNPIAIPVNS